MDPYKMLLLSLKRNRIVGSTKRNQHVKRRRVRAFIRRQQASVQSAKVMAVLMLQRLSPAHFSRSTVNISLVAALALGTIGASLPALIAQYNEKQARIPQALTAEAQPTHAPAADALPSSSKATPVSADLQSRLDAERDRMQNGRQPDRRQVAEVTEKRDSHSRTFLNADGTHTKRYSFAPKSYQDNGQWKDIDATLEHDAGAGEWRTKANDWKASLGRDALIKIAKGAQTFSMRPTTSQSAEPVVSGTAPNQEVKYRNVWPGIDLVYNVNGNEVKETIVVKSRAAATDFSFDLAGAGLTPDPSNPGGYRLDGELSDLRISPVNVATQTEGIIGGAPTVHQTLSGNRLTVHLDPAWLQNQPFEAFPVIIDPTIERDQNNYKSYKHDNFECGSTCGNSVGATSGGDHWRLVAHVPFSDLSSNYIISAGVHLGMAGCDSSYGTCDNRTVTVRHASGWCYGCLDNTYDTRGGLFGQDGWIDATQIFHNMIDNNLSDASLIFNGEEGGSTSFKKFDPAGTYIEFVYDALPTYSTRIDPSPADEGVIVNTQPTLYSTTSTDPDTGTDNPGPVRYKYIIGTSKTGSGSGRTPSVSGIVADSGYYYSPKWTVPDNVLQDGTTYYWQAVAWDGWAAAPGAYSPVYSFKVDMRTGKDATQAFDGVGPVNVNLATGNLTTSAKTHSIAALGGSLGVGLDYNSPVRSRPGLVGQYWTDPSATRTFPSTAAAVTRVDPNVDFSWSTNSPSVGTDDDNFLARWSGYFVAPKAGTYQFGTTSDDGSRIYVDNTLHYNGWSGSQTNAYGSGVALTEGQVVPIKYEFAEWTGGASAQMLVKTTDTGIIAAQVVPTDWLQTGVRPTATPHGLVGRYYPGSTLPSSSTDAAGAFLVRTDATPSMDWGSSSPVPNGPADNFVARWTGYFKAPQAGDYKFGGHADDGIKVIVNGATQVDRWTAGANYSPVWASGTVPFAAGETKAITVEFKEQAGTASLGLYADGPGIEKTRPIPSDWLLPRAQVLPDGWNLGVDADGDLGYDFAVIGQGGVVLRGSDGATHEYKYENGGYKPPANEAGHMVRNGDGTITLQDTDGRTYVFNPDGTLKLATMPVDDRNPAALQYSYGIPTGGVTPVLEQITDAVDSSRWAKVFYSGSSSCPSVPSGFVSTPGGMICAVTTSDGQMTKFLYATDSAGTTHLSRLEHPGGGITDYSYLPGDGTNSCAGCLQSMRDVLANDAISAGVRTQDTTVLTSITYDALGRATGVTMPAATAGATRLARTYEYFGAYGSSLAYSKTHVTGATEPNGFSRKITYDTTYRTITDTDTANLTTTTEWDVDATGAPRKDLLLDTVDPAGLRSTTKYDEDDRPVHQYGPAPTAWFSTDTNNRYQYATSTTTYNTPLTTPTDYTTQVPHTQTGYDEGIAGLAAAYYDVTTSSSGTGSTTKLLHGGPRDHATGIAAAPKPLVPPKPSTTTPAASSPPATTQTPGPAPLTTPAAASPPLPSPPGAASPPAPSPIIGPSVTTH